MSSNILYLIKLFGHARADPPARAPPSVSAPIIAERAFVQIREACARSL